MSIGSKCADPLTLVSLDWLHELKFVLRNPGSFLLPPHARPLTHTDCPFHYCLSQACLWRGSVSQFPLSFLVILLEKRSFHRAWGTQMTRVHWWGRNLCPRPNFYSLLLLMRKISILLKNINRCANESVKNHMHMCLNRWANNFVCAEIHLLNLITRQ